MSRPESPTPQQWARRDFLIMGGMVAAIYVGGVTFLAARLVGSSSPTPEGPEDVYLNGAEYAGKRSRAEKIIDGYLANWRESTTLLSEARRRTNGDTPFMKAAAAIFPQADPETVAFYHTSVQDAPGNNNDQKRETHPLFQVARAFGDPYGKTDTSIGIVEHIDPTLYPLHHPRVVILPYLIPNQAPAKAIDYEMLVESAMRFDPTKGLSYKEAWSMDVVNRVNAATLTPVKDFG